MNLTYTGVYVHHKEHIIVPSIIDEFEDDNRDHGIVLHFIEEEWAQHLIDDNSICGVTSIHEPQTKFFVAGVDGRIDIADKSGPSQEFVDQSDRRPDYSKTIRCIKRIGDKIYATGMARQVYVRNQDNKWSQLDKGVYVPSGQMENVSGFLDIDGYQNGILYAVGYEGEIFFFDGKNWTQEDSITNVALTCMKVLSEEDVVIAGMAGVIIRGSHGKWKVIEHEETKEDFWGVTTFQSKIYLSNYEGIFILDGESLSKIDMNMPSDFTTAYIDSADGIICSVGQKNIALSTDGIHWNEIEGP